MKELVFDTATNCMYIGLINEDKQDTIIRIGKNDNSAFLVDKIDELLKRNELTLSDIDNIIVGVGPGSYTGVRVSVVVAKTLSFAKQIPLKQISSLQFLSSGYEHKIKPIIDARRGYYFKGEYENNIQVYKDEYVKIDQIDEYLLLNGDTIKIDLSQISKHATTVIDVHDLEPNYLRKTEAENELDQKNERK